MRIAGTKQAILDLFSAGEDICLASYMVHELLGKDHSSAKVSASLNSLLRGGKLFQSGQGNIELLMLPETRERRKQRMSESMSITYPTMLPGKERRKAEKVFHTYPS